MFDDMSDGAKWAAGIFVTGCVILAIVLAWFKIFGPLFNQAGYQNFNNSSQHLQAVAQKAADDCEQLAGTKDTVSRKAIEEDIYQVVSTVDLNRVQMPDGVRSCVNQAITDVTKGK